MWMVIFMGCLLITIFVWLTQRTYTKDLIPMTMLTGFAFWRFWSLKSQ